MGRPKKIKTVAAPAKEWSVSLTCGDQEFKASGDTVIDAFQALPQTTKVLQKGLLKVTHGDKSNEKFLYANQVRKVLGYKLQRAVWAKLFSYGL